MLGIIQGLVPLYGSEEKGNIRDKSETCGPGLLLTGRTMVPKI